MDTLTQHTDIKPDGGARAQFLPPESPMAMSKQPLRDFESRPGNQSAALESVALRRACIFAGTAAITGAGCYEMYEVLQVGASRCLNGLCCSCSCRCLHGLPSRSCQRWPASRCCYCAPGIRWASIPTHHCRRSRAGAQCCCRPTTKTLTGSWLDFVRCTSRSASPDTVQGSTGLC